MLPFATFSPNARDVAHEWQVSYDILAKVWLFYLLKLGTMCLRVGAKERPRGESHNVPRAPANSGATP